MRLSLSRRCGDCVLAQNSTLELQRGQPSAFVVLPQTSYKVADYGQSKVTHVLKAMRRFKWLPFLESFTPSLSSYSFSRHLL